MRIQLLSIKYDDKVRQPILPLESNDVDALKKSPLVALTLPGDDLSQLASEWMGPGPWTFHQDLQLPASCSVLHFTNKNKRSYMSVTHLLKCVMRVERGDNVAIDPKTGNPMPNLSPTLTYELCNGQMDFHIFGNCHAAPMSAFPCITVGMLHATVTLQGHKQILTSVSLKIGFFLMGISRLVAVNSCQKLRVGSSTLGLELGNKRRE
jgi:hypothetical protein